MKTTMPSAARVTRWWIEDPIDPAFDEDDGTVALMLEGLRLSGSIQMHPDASTSDGPVEWMGWRGYREPERRREGRATAAAPAREVRLANPATDEVGDEERLGEHYDVFLKDPDARFWRPAGERLGYHGWPEPERGMICVRGPFAYVLEDEPWFGTFRVRFDEVDRQLGTVKFRFR